MTDLLPVEIRSFTRLMEVVAVHSGEEVPTIRMLCQKLQAILPVSREESAKILFDHVSAVEKLIDEHMVTPGSKRSGGRLKVRIARLFDPNELAKNYSKFQSEQQENVLAILDLIPLLDDVKFDGEKLIESRGEIISEIDNLLGKILSSNEVSDAIKSISLAQVEMIKRTLVRFEFEGVVPFREAIYCTIGRLTLELKGIPETKQGGIREIIDDLVRIKDMAEIAAGTLKLAGPFIAGLLAAPAA